MIITNEALQILIFIFIIQTIIYLYHRIRYALSHWIDWYEAYLEYEVWDITAVILVLWELELTIAVLALIFNYYLKLW